MWLSQRIPTVWLITTPVFMTGGQPLETGHLLSHLLAQSGTFSTTVSPPGSGELLGKPEARAAVPVLLKQGDRKHMWYRLLVKS